MSLLGAHHRNRWSAALSIAANRASKVSLLRASGRDDIADRHAASLAADVEVFLAKHPSRPPRFAVALREAAESDE